MKKENYLKFVPLAIGGVIVGLTLIVYLFTKITGIFGIDDLFFRIEKLPHFVLYFVGAANVITFLPIFIAGILILRPKGAVGYSEKLVTKGIYRYVRNPMYSGLCFTIFGAGFLFHNSGISIAALFWLLICFVQVLREENELKKRFAPDYIVYKENTPRFIPDFALLVSELFGVRVKIKRKT